MTHIQFKRLAAISLVLVMCLSALPLISPTAEAAGEGWLDGWSHRVSHTINGKPSVESFYQVPIVVRYAAGTHTETAIGDINAPVLYVNGISQASFSDIRFTADDGVTLLPYWMEEKTDADEALFWVRLPSLTTDRTIYIYFGNAIAGSLSDGEATFAFFDHMGAPDPVWIKHFAVIPRPNATYSIGEPTVLYEGNPKLLTSEAKVFKMWYGEGDVYTNLQGQRYAESTNGIDWTIMEDYVWTAGPGNGLNVYGGASVCKAEGVYYMYTYHVYLPGSFVGVRTSTDGITWTEETTALTGNTGWGEIYGNTHVIYHGPGDWSMLFECRPQGGIWKIGLATSTDGYSWTPYGSAPVIGSTSHDGGGPDVHYINGMWYTWYHGGHAGQLPCDGMMATSTDLKTWTYSPYNPVFPRTEEWEGVGNAAGQVSDMTIVEANGKSYCFYVGLRSQDINTGSTGISVAIADMPLSEVVKTPQNSAVATPLDTSKWTVSAGTFSNGALTGEPNLWAKMKSVQSFKANHALRVGGQMIGTMPGVASKEGQAIGLEDVGQTKGIDIIRYNTGTASEQLRAPATTPETSISTAPSVFEIGYTPNRADYFQNNVALMGSPITTATIPDLDYQVKLEAAGGADHKLIVDWVAVRERVYPEVTQGGFSEMEVNMVPVDPSTWAPSFTTTPKTTATVNGTYQYAITVNETAAVALVDSPEWLTLKNGVLTGVPTEIGTYYVSLKAVSTAGTLATYQSWTITVVADDGTTDPGDDDKDNITAGITDFAKNYAWLIVAGVGAIVLVAYAVARHPVVLIVGIGLLALAALIRYGVI